MNSDLASRLAILVIDDDALLRRSIERALRHHHVELAASSATARALVERRAFDVVLCDLHLGEADGREVCASLATLDPLLRGRCILMSGSDRKEPELARAADGLTVLEKPFGIATLDATIEALLQSVGARRLRSAG